MDYKSSFLKFYANLPISVREEIVLDLGDIGTITWKVAYREISADTPLGKEILDKLVKLKFIPTE